MKRLRTLVVAVLENQIISFLTDRKNNVYDFAVTTGNSLRSIVRDYKFVSKVILIVDIKPEMLLREFPVTMEKDLHNIATNSLRNNFSYLTQERYTMGWRLLAVKKEIYTVLIASEISKVEPYIKVFEELKIEIDVLDIYENFANLYICQQDKRDKIIIFNLGERVVLHIVKDNLFQFVNTLYNEDFLFNLSGIQTKIDIAYIENGVCKNIVDYLEAEKVEIVHFDNVFELFAMDTFDVKRYFN